MRRRGMTIVEVIIAAAVLSLVLYGAVNLIRGTRIFTQRVGGREDTQELALLCMRKVVDELSEASAVLYPSLNADGSPCTKSFVVYRTFEEEVALLYLDHDDDTIKRSCLRWNGAGTAFEPMDPQALATSSDLKELYFTAAGAGAFGTHLRLSLRTSKDWFFEGVTPWNARQ